MYGAVLTTGALSMKMDIKRKWPVAALSMIGMASTLSAARNQDAEHCAPAPPATCYADNCNHCYCLGPDNYGVNAPVRPRTCNGDWVVTAAGFYWNSHQDGMEYALHNGVVGPGEDPDVNGGAGITAIWGLNNLVDAKFLNPNYKWDFGFKLGLGYNTTCDGWDIGVLWTWYRGKANDHVEAEQGDNAVLLPLWSAYAPLQGLTLYATDIETNWNLELNLVDIDMGREFWTSKYLTMRPHIGVRIAFLDQKYKIAHKGGSFSANSNAGANPIQTGVNNTVLMHNDFSGAGIRAGLETVWNLGCGWGLYGDFSLSIIYGRFSVKYDETNRGVVTPHSRKRIAETYDSFRASRAIADLGLGVQYHTMFCDCAYGFTAMLGWEHHLFFDQNQLWRVVRLGDVPGNSPSGEQSNTTGENSFHQRRGDLDTQGWTLTLRFEF